MLDNFQFNNPLKDISLQKWKDWHWQVANRITTVEGLKSIINLTTDEEKGIRRLLP